MIRLQSFFSTIEQSIGNLHLAEVQKIIKEDLKGKSGIYGFVCETTDKLYIGSSINLAHRFSEHFNGTRSNILLQKAINKYNTQDFIFVIFEYCDIEILISREQFYLDALSPEFNILKIAGSSLGLKHSKETLALMREAKKGDKHPMFGRTGDKHPMFGILGENHHFYGKNHTPETLTKLSLAKGGGIIFVYDIQDTLVNTFSSARKAAEHFNSNHSTILKYVKNENLFRGKWRLTFSAKEL
jgi:group I intron endonuclease